MRHYVERYRPDWPRPVDSATAPGVALPPPSLESFDALVARLHAAKTRHYTELLAAGGIPLRPGVRRLLAAARAAGLRLAIATTTTPANVSALLRHALGPDAESWFEVIGAGDVVPAKKPAPDIYYYVLERLGLAPAACLAFEDSENGLRAARGANLATVVTVNDYTRGHDFGGAAIVLDHLGEQDRPFTVLSGPRLNRTSFMDINFLLQLYAA